MSKRTADSSKWFLPLVAGPEIADRSGPRVTLDLPDVLPGAAPWILPGLVLWLDAVQGAITLPAGGVYRWIDQSGEANHAVQPLTAAQPTLLSTTLLPRAVNFE